MGETRFITFRAGGHDFAVPIEKVREVLTLSFVFPVPGGRRPLLGIISYRNKRVLPVFSLLDALGEEGAGTGHLIVVWGPESAPAGFAVDGLGGIVTASGQEEEIEPYQGTLGGPEGAVPAVLKKAGGDHILLEIDKVLGF